MLLPNGGGGAFTERKCESEVSTRLIADAQYTGQHRQLKRQNRSKGRGVIDSTAEARTAGRAKSRRQ
jgi:hypothetical protein